MKIILITSGNIEGIGPEVILKTITGLSSSIKSEALVITGPAAHYRRLTSTLPDVELPDEVKIARTIDEVCSPGLWLLDDGRDPGPVSYGEYDPRLADFPRRYLEQASRLALAGIIDAVVTGPIDKRIFEGMDGHFTGQTTFFAARAGAASGSGTPPFLMLFANRFLKVALVTTHVALFRLGEHLTRPLIVEKAQVLDSFLKRYYRIPRPRIGVCGINPHCGDGGMYGREDLEITAPAVDQLKGMGIDAFGPMPADALLNQKNMSSFDAALAMYHDQGTVPMKLIDFSGTVNITAGLPYPRVSPDHGTACDIAGRGLADPGSMTAAVQAALLFTGSHE